MVRCSMVSSAAIIGLVLLASSNPFSTSTSSAISNGPIVFADAFSKDTTPPVDTVKRAKPSNSIRENRRTQRELPNPADPETAVALKCNACVAVAHELHVSLSRLYSLRHNAPKYVEQVEAMDEVCNKMVETYGIAVDEETDKPTLLFRSKDETARAITGGWISSTIGDRCTSIIESYEGEIIKQMGVSAKAVAEARKKNKNKNTKKSKKSSSHNDDEDEAEADAARVFTQYLCVKVDGSCELPDDGEGEIVGDL